MIHKLSERRDLFPLLVKSICPSIFGNEIVKTGQLMSLMGGTDYRLKLKGADLNDLLNKEANNHHADEDMEDEKSMPPIRPDIHVLMVGEPGMGKS